MTDENSSSSVFKNVRVSVPTHGRLIDYQHKVRARSAEEAMKVLLGEDVVHIPVPDAARERWEAAAAEAGFPLAQWVIQHVEAFLAYRADPRDIRHALDSTLAALWGESVPTGKPKPLPPEAK